MRAKLLKMYKETRQVSIAMCEPLQPDEFQVQTMPSVSPPKWNLGHTSWFFWRFILRAQNRTLPVDEEYQYFLNSYYYKAGDRVARDRRGLITRPSLSEIYQYRKLIDERMEALIVKGSERELEDLDFLIHVGVNHEQQHQELFYTEIKNIYFASPSRLRPSYLPNQPLDQPPTPEPPSFIPYPGGVYEFGNIEGGWCWDNELAVHPFALTDFELEDRLVTNAEYLEFIQDGGYGNPLLWLSDGWAAVLREQWRAPLYWERRDGEWWIFTLSGMQRLNPHEPLCHVSFYEAHAFARWKSETDRTYRRARLPFEREWEFAARSADLKPHEGHFVEDGRIHPLPASGDHSALRQMFGDVWEWTLSHYQPYPGFVEFPDNLSEYNGKFMNNQRVLRGGSCATPAHHVRVSYRNFWPPATRFQFSGIRLAREP